MKTKIKMKPYTLEEKKIAEKRAYNYLFSLQNVLLNKKFQYDRRYRVGKLANSIILNKQLTPVQKMEILEKRRFRAKSRQISPTILRNPILIDYLKHKSDVKYIHDSFIQFYGRNHHAKNAQDFMVLKVLKKHFKK